MKREICYVNTDLILQAPLDLAPLADALTDRGLFLYHAGPRHDDSWAATFTVSPILPEFREPDHHIIAVLDAIESLKESVQSLWTACTVRDFNIRYHCGDTPWTFSKQHAPATLARMAAVGAGLMVTINAVTEIDAINAAVDILTKDKRIKRYIGKYQSLGIHPANSLSIKRNQAEVKVTLTGNKGSVFVHCLMQLTMEGEWGLKEILEEEERFPPTA